jgi:predicted outer membrane repeat protein
MMLLVARSARADIINVPDDYETIQEAIEAADPGDEVVVAEGEYFENIDFLGKAITVRSTDPADSTVVVNTIINGGGTGTVVTCENGESESTVLAGFVITNGNSPSGGGMYNDGSSPTVTRCTFIGNSAEWGGGMYNSWDAPPGADRAGDRGPTRIGASPTVTYCTFVENSAENGGAICNVDDVPAEFRSGRLTGDAGSRSGARTGPQSSPSIVGCTFRQNQAVWWGGAICTLYSMPTVTDCIFDRNMIDHDGGGMFIYAGSDTMVTNCTFTGNSAGEHGGGIGNNAACPTIADCSFIGNSAGESGGGISSDPGLPTLGDTVVCLNTPDQIGGDWTDGGGNIIGPYPPPPAISCPADVDGDGDVDTSDLLALLAAWGMCP